MPLSSRSSISYRAVGLLALLTLSTGVGACVKNKSLVRPNERKATDALGEGKCNPKTLAADASPLVVDWGDSDRASLEAEMSRGVALVKYTCDGVKVLKGCAVEGVYTYAGVSKKTRLVRMEDMAEVKANLTAGQIPVSIAAELARGATLDLAYVMVGTEATTVNSVVRGDLPDARCSEATHFVYDAHVGAFAMETGAAGEARAAVDVLGRGVKAGRSSSKETRTTDGDPDACENSAGSAPVEGCHAILRVTLFPVETGEAVAVADGKKGTVDGRGGCADGFRFNDGACERVAKVSSYLCEKGNTAECEQQCDLGSWESCGRLANGLLVAMQGPMDDATAEKAVMPRLARFKSACVDHGEADACTVAGVGVILPMMSEPNLDVNKHADDIKSMTDYFERGCRGGEPYSCELIQMVYLEGSFDPVIKQDAARYIKDVAMSCDAGAAPSCGIAAREFAFGRHVQVNGSRALDLASRACQGGIASNCVIAGALLLDKEGCGAVMGHYEDQRAAGAGTTPDTYAFNGEEQRILCDVASQANFDVPKAVDWFKHGCRIGDATSCSLAEVLGS